MRRLTALAVASLVVLTPLQSLAQSKIAGDVAAVMNRPSLRASQFGMAFYDLDRGKMLFARDSDKFFVAASTTKVVTESTSLALLGPA